MLEYTLKPQISLAPEPSPDDDQDSPTDPDGNGDDGEDSTADDGSSDGDSTTPDDSTSDESDNSEAPVDAEGARRALPNTQDLLRSIKSSNNFSQRVSYMNIAIETVQ